MLQSIHIERKTLLAGVPKCIITEIPISSVHAVLQRRVHAVLHQRELRYVHTGPLRQGFTRPSSIYVSLDIVRDIVPLFTIFFQSPSMPNLQ